MEFGVRVWRRGDGAEEVMKPPRVKMTGEKGRELGRYMADFLPKQDLFFKKNNENNVLLQIFIKIPSEIKS